MHHNLKQFDNINKVSDAEQPVVDIAYDPNLSDRPLQQRKQKHYGKA
ncbi:hypothetical protein [Nostoc sp.]